jgi:hypothetical protein
MDNGTVRLSVEELALVLTNQGLQSVAENLVVAQLGAMHREEYRARLIAAAHALMARGWLELTTGGEFMIAESIARLGRVVTHPDFSIRYSRSNRDQEFNQTYHFLQGEIFAHTLEQGVVHVIDPINDRDAIARGGLEFFHTAHAPAFSSQAIDIPNSAMSAIKDLDDAVAIAQRLADLGLDQEARARFAEDVAHTQFRGSVMRIEYGADNSAVSNRGFFILRGAERLWLLRPFQRDQEAWLSLLPGTSENIQQEIRGLLS